MPPINADALKHLRLKDGHSLASLAREADVQPAHLSNIEAGRRGASPALTKRLAQALGVPISAIVAQPAPTTEAVA